MEITNEVVLETVEESQTLENKKETLVDIGHITAKQIVDYIRETIESTKDIGRE